MVAAKAKKGTRAVPSKPAKRTQRVLKMADLLEVLKAHSYRLIRIEKQGQATAQRLTALELAERTQNRSLTFIAQRLGINLQAQFDPTATSVLDWLQQVEARQIEVKGLLSEVRLLLQGVDRSALASLRAQVDAQTGALVDINNHTVTELRELQALAARIAEWAGDTGALRQQFTPEAYHDILNGAAQRLDERIEALVRDSVMREALEKIAMVKYSGVIGDRKAEVADALKQERAQIAELLTDVTSPDGIAAVRRIILARSREM